MTEMIIHVGQQTIRSNVKHNADAPALILRRKSKSNRAHRLIIRDKQGNVVAEFVQRMHNPLACGARVWCIINDTHASVEMEINNADQ